MEFQNEETKKLTIELQSHKLKYAPRLDLTKIQRISLNAVSENFGKFNVCKKEEI